MKNALIKFTPTPKNSPTFQLGDERHKKRKNVLMVVCPAVRGFIFGIYQVFISPALHAVSPFAGSGCRFYPTCSVFAAEALARHGFFLGFLKTCRRILRCNPFNRGGYEPLL